ncbi:MAG: RNA-binding transcriptional accessory protein [Chitinophagaceae bacterium]|nr:RNA-binding transcriptional accessory protein [Chitinophagaceae bacterium]
MLSKYIAAIALQTSTKPKQVEQVEQLFEQGATIPFIARYRKEVTGNLDEVVLEQLKDKLQYFNDLEKRKETVLKTIEDLGKLTPELRKQIDDTMEQHILEDIYLPYKPKRKTRATIAIEKGLEPLAQLLYEQHEACMPTVEAANFLNEQVPDIQEALKGAKDIIAEWVNEHAVVRDTVRTIFSKEAIITCKVMKGKEVEGIKYKDYYDCKEVLSKCPSHRMLAMRRGEKEGFLSLDISVEEADALEAMDDILLQNDSESAIIVQEAITDCYKRLLKPSIEVEFRLSTKNKADEEAIQVFATNTRQLLLSPPLGQRNLLSIDPGFRTGCKVVVLDKQGTLVHNTTIYPHPPQHQEHEAIETIKHLVATYQIEAICIGNGTAGKETEQVLRKISFDKPLDIFLISEAGASIYSASEVAREEFPNQDVTVRGAISIGRRLMDPLSELVKIDPKSIGVGQYQHDVNQHRLKESLDQVVVSCVNAVGVEVNTASKHILTYISGLSSTLARNIVQYRSENGPFRNRQELMKVPLMGSKTFQQAAGFLRIAKGNHSLDNSAVHPERYALVEKMAKDLNCTIDDLMQQESIRKKIDLRKYVSEEVGMFTLQDILQELEKPGRDPRSVLQQFQYADGLSSIEDLYVGMVLPGIITNITNFGAFVDIGVKQDGLVHVSHLANKFVKDPNDVVKLNQHVTVKVTDVDIPRKRIQLSMKEV